MHTSHERCRQTTKGSFRVAACEECGDPTCGREATSAILSSGRLDFRSTHNMTSPSLHLESHTQHRLSAHREAGDFAIEEQEEQLPSYQAATTHTWKKGDGFGESLIGIVAPYLEIDDYWWLCRVDKCFYARFAPLLFKDALAVVAKLSSVSRRARARYENLVRGIPNMRPSTLLMVATLDFRAMRATRAYDPLLLRSLVQRFVQLAPNMRCLAVDRRPDFNPRQLADILDVARSEAALRAPSKTPARPLKTLAILSLRNCSEVIPWRIFDDRRLHTLVYLDISNNHDSLNQLLKPDTIFGSNLPNLRVLKLANMGLNSLVALSGLSRHQLRSLDVSGNKVDVPFLFELRDRHLRARPRLQRERSPYFEVEGQLELGKGPVHVAYTVCESASSETFSHPHRYLADTPRYSANDDEAAQTQLPIRLTGMEHIYGDSLDKAITVMTGGAHDAVPVCAEWPGRVSDRGLTHLHLNGTEADLEDIQNELALCDGLVHFDCDQARLFTRKRKGLGDKIPWIATGLAVFGFPGSAHLFRPVYSSNLRVLRTHHSLVTNTPTVASNNGSLLEHIWVAERLSSSSFQLAYPQTYVPDMNPRLYSLTLAKIPRLSTGVVTERIINFLKLLAHQEQGIEQMKKSMPRRGPSVLSGLRHICLEFDTDVKEDLANLTINDDLDQATDSFSSFTLSETDWDTAFTSPISVCEPPKASSRSVTSIAPSSASDTSLATPVADEPPHQLSTTDSGRLDVFPFTGTTTNSILHKNLQVWIGNGIIGPLNPPAVNAYMLNLTQYQQGIPAWNLINIIVATPCHIIAGVPQGAYIFGAAWDKIAEPRQQLDRPTRAELAGMRDVEQDIREFRRSSRREYKRLLEAGELSGEVGQHDYYNGRVEISR